MSSKKNCSEPQSKGAPTMWTQREVAQLDGKPTGVKMLYPWPQNVDRVFLVSLWMTPVKKLESGTPRVSSLGMFPSLNYPASRHEFSIVYPNCSAIGFGKHSFKDTLALSIFEFHTDSTNHRLEILGRKTLHLHWTFVDFFYCSLNTTHKHLHRMHILWCIVKHLGLFYSVWEDVCGDKQVLCFCIGDLSSWGLWYLQRFLKPIPSRNTCMRCFQKRAEQDETVAKNSSKSQELVT